MKNLQHKYYESYKDNKLLLPGLDISWLKELREEAIAQFKKDGFPDKSVEEWNNHSYPTSEEIHNTIISIPAGLHLTDSDVERITEVLNKY